MVLVSHNSMCDVGIECVAYTHIYIFTYILTYVYVYMFISVMNKGAHDLKSGAHNIKKGAHNLIGDTKNVEAPSRFCVGWQIFV